MRIVNIEEDFHPLAGYQLNILAKHFARMGHEVIIITGEQQYMKSKFKLFFDTSNLTEQDLIYEKTFGVKIIRKPVYGYFNKKNFYRLGFLKYFHTLRFIKKIKPDILYIHGNEQTISIMAFILYKFMNIPYITDSHMVEMALEGKSRKLFFQIYKKIVTPIFIKYKITNIRTQNEDFVERYLGIPLDQSPWISVGSDTMLFHKDDNVRKEFRLENNICEDAFVVIYAGKLDWEKGGELLADTFLEEFNQKKVVLMVVGNSNDDTYGREIEKKFTESKNTIIRFPTQKYSELAKFYQASDLGVFPRQCSLSFYDLQACAVPVVLEDNNINIDRITNGNGLCFNSGDSKDFRRAIINILELPQDQYSKMSSNAESFVTNNYSYELISKLYIDEIVSSINKFHLRRSK